MKNILILLIVINCIWLNTANAVATSNANSHGSANHDYRSADQILEAKKYYLTGDEYYKKNDYLRSIDWMRRSAELGYPAAMLRLVVLKAKDTDHQDYQSAYMWAVLYMLHTKEYSHMEALLPWLSLNEMEIAHENVIVWLEERNINKEAVNELRKYLSVIMSKMEQENLAVSEMTSIYNDITWIFINPLILNYIIQK